MIQLIYNIASLVLREVAAKPTEGIIFTFSLIRLLTAATFPRGGKACEVHSLRSHNFIWR